MHVWMTTRAGDVLCRLEAVYRAALRLEIVSNRWRDRTRKVEPGNEPEGGRALAGTLQAAFAARCRNSDNESQGKEAETSCDNESGKESKGKRLNSTVFSGKAMSCTGWQVCVTWSSQPLLLLLAVHDDIDDAQIIF